MKKIFLAACTVALSATFTFAAETSKPISVGSPGQWTATTIEAANNPVAKDYLTKAVPATITGEVVDVSCYLQLGKRGEKHIDCGKKCVINGQPFGIVDANNKLTILFAEEHHPRRDGKVSLREKFASLMAKTVTASGMLTQTNGYAALYVQAEPLTPRASDKP